MSSPDGVRGAVDEIRHAAARGFAPPERAAELTGLPVTMLGTAWPSCME
jgi:hypothetical protein